MDLREGSQQQNPPYFPNETFQTDIWHLHSLLSPIGEYRSQHVVPSKGKRKKKRKREQERAVTDQERKSSEGEASRASPPAPPEVQKHLTIGFNTTTKYLESLAQRSSPSSQVPSSDNAPGLKAPTTSPSENSSSRPLDIVFAPRSDQFSILYSHLPLLTKTASLASSSSSSVRLVMLPKGAEERLGAALSIPRVGLIGLIDGAPESQGLIEFVRKCVPQVEVPWIQEAMAGAYLPVKINEIETSVPVESKRKGPPPVSKAAKNQ